MKYKSVLTIAGSDSSGGAGIQADIKAISACNCYACSAITAITAQNTIGVQEIFPLPEKIISAQIEAVLKDIGANAIKIGMLHNSKVIEVVVKSLKKFELKNIVLDPVMVATSGDKLLQDEAIETLKLKLIPLVRVITPNIPEAEILSGEKITKQNQLPILAEKLAKKYKVSVLLKAGHLKEKEVEDIFYNQENDTLLKLSSSFIQTKNTHGTGCTLSSALAAYLAQDYTLEEAVSLAKEYIFRAIEAGKDYNIGSGHGPVHHFYKFWK